MVSRSPGRAGRRLSHSSAARWARAPIEGATARRELTLSPEVVIFHDEPIGPPNRGSNISARSLLPPSVRLVCALQGTAAWIATTIGVPDRDRAGSSFANTQARESSSDLSGMDALPGVRPRHAAAAMAAASCPSQPHSRTSAYHGRSKIGLRVGSRCVAWCCDVIMSGVPGGPTCDTLGAPRGRIGR